MAPNQNFSYTSQLGIPSSQCDVIASQFRFDDGSHDAFDSKLNDKLASASGRPSVKCKAGSTRLLGVGIESNVTGDPPASSSSTAADCIVPTASELCVSLTEPAVFPEEKTATSSRFAPTACGRLSPACSHLTATFCSGRRPDRGYLTPAKSELTAPCRLEIRSVTNASSKKISRQLR